MAVLRVTSGGTVSATAATANCSVASSGMTGMVDGVLLVASIGHNGGTGPSAGPANWFQELNDIASTNPRQQVWTHYVSSAAGEPASWTWTSPAVAWSLVITAYTGHNISSNGSTAFDAKGIANSGAATATACVAPDITSTVANTVIVGGATGNSATTTWLAGAGNTGNEVYDAGASKSHCFYSDETFVGPGAVGTTTFTQSAARAYVAWQAVIAPATAAAADRVPPFQKVFTSYPFRAVQ